MSTGESGGGWTHAPRVELAAGLVHDFRNLLTVVIGFAESALSSLSPDHAAFRDVELVMFGAKRLAHLIGPLLQLLTRPMSDGPPNYSRALWSLKSLLERTMSPDASLQVHVAEGLPPASLSSLDFERIVLNLVLNARTALGGAGSIVVRLEEAEPTSRAREELRLRPGPHVVLTVTDDGPGLPVGLRDQLFDPGVTTGAGHGLGLAVVRRLTESAGGAVHVWSQPAQGTRFSVWFPALRSRNAEE